MKFNIVMSNPPYNSGIDIKILQEIVPISDELVVVHPATWLLDNKFNSNLFTGFRELIANHLVSSTMFNGNIEFGIQLFVPTSITHIYTKNQIPKTKLNYFGKLSTYDDISDITVFGDDWLTTVKPFSESIEKYIDDNLGSVWQKRCELIIKHQGKAYCQLADIRGTPNRHTDDGSMHLNDFYTIVTKDSETNEDIRKEDIKNSYRFETAKEVRNFINYCKTDFARFCVAIYKTNAHLDSGEMLHLPYLDFTQEWTDESLYKHFNVNNKTKQYITKFLPKFYGDSNG